MTIGRLLGVDHGLKRVGVAVSDALGISARELAIVAGPSDEAVYAEIKRLVNEQLAVGVIVGLPSNEGDTKQADIVKLWVKGLREVVTVPVVLWDEQLSSADAKELAKELRRKPSERIDDLAARVILQSYINAVADGLAEPPSA
jgi:putative holliday junction resolvase